MNLGIDVSVSGLIISGFAISFALWGISRGASLLYELFASRSGRVRPF